MKINDLQIFNSIIQFAYANGYEVNVVDKITLNKKGAFYILNDTPEDYFAIITGKKKADFYELSITDIENVVLAFFNQEKENVYEKNRKREFCQTRQIIHYLCKSLTNQSLTEIGRRVGGVTHSSILHSVKTVQNLIDTDKYIRKCVKDLCTILGHASYL